MPTTSSSSNSEDGEQLSSESVSLEQPPKKKAFPAQLTTERSPSTELSWAEGKVQEEVENNFLGWNMMRITMERLCLLSLLYAPLQIDNSAKSGPT